MMMCETAPDADNADAAQGDTPCMTIVSEPGPGSLLRALGLLSVSGLSPHSIDLRHPGPDGRAVSRIGFLPGTDRARLSAIARKISQMPTVSSVETGEPRPLDLKSNCRSLS